MPGRQVTGEYRYGFGGHEKDDEVKGAGKEYATEFRQYDPRLGRWMAVDPLAAKMPDWSPYSINFNSPLQFIDPDGRAPMGIYGDYYDNKGKFIATDGINDNKIYVVKSSTVEFNILSCAQLKSVSAEVTLSSKANKESTLSHWAKKYQSLSNRYNSESNGGREYAMSLFSGIITTPDGPKEVFIEGNTVKGNKDVVPLTDSKSPIDGWNASESIHTHTWGNDSGRFSDGRIGPFSSDIPTSLKSGNPLYLVVPYSNYIGVFEPEKYKDYTENGDSHETAKRKAINNKAIKIE